MQIKPGYRVAFRAHGHSLTRTVSAVGEGYVIVYFQGQQVKVPQHKITSYVKG